MATLTIHYDARNNDANTLAAFLKSLSYITAVDEPEYDPDFVSKIRKGEKDIADGKGKAVKLDDLWK